MMPKHKISEQQLQEQVVQYMQILQATTKHFIMFTKIPNETFTRSWSQKRKNKREGLNGGLPDLFIIINNKSLWIELKVGYKKPSQNQKKWHEALKAAGHDVYVAYSLKECKEIINFYL